MQTALRGFLLIGFILLQACATPSERFAAEARQLRFSEQLLSGAPFQHRVYLNALADLDVSISELHVYLDGDGTPWRTSSRIADDPTARNPLILSLMAKDPAASLLLGRPCYYGLNLSVGCDEAWWTSQRYAVQVVNSMVAALQHWLAGKKVTQLVLIGYSGGGALAVLMAQRLQNVSLLVTMAANLDTQAWSQYHGYPAPAGSLNPAVDASVPAAIRQVHLAGLKDENVPADIIENFSRAQGNSRYMGVPNFTHDCCWPEIWPDILHSEFERH